jgi:hypothetical protein
MLTSGFHGKLLNKSADTPPWHATHHALLAKSRRCSLLTTGDFEVRQANESLIILLRNVTVRRDEDQQPANDAGRLGQSGD